jgi:hypothetical protein
MKSIYIRLILLMLIFNPVIAQEPIHYGVSSMIFSFEDTSEYKYIKIDSTGVWKIVQPLKEILFIPENAPSYGRYAIITEPDSASYDTNVFSSFQFKLIITSGVDFYAIGFDHKFDFERNQDGGVLETSYDLGQTWTNLLYDTNIFNHIDYVSNFYSEEDLIAAYNNQPGFTGTKADMTRIDIYFDFNDELKGDTLLIRFLVISDSIDSGNEGWMLDEIGFGGGFVPIETFIGSKINVFPNPVLDNLNIDSPEIQIDRVEILDLLGNILVSSKYQRSIPVGNLSRGVYILILNNNIVRKIVKK